MLLPVCQHVRQQHPGSEDRSHAVLIIKMTVATTGAGKKKWHGIKWLTFVCLNPAKSFHWEPFKFCCWIYNADKTTCYCSTTAEKRRERLRKRRLRQREKEEKEKQTLKYTFGWRSSHYALKHACWEIWFSIYQDDWERDLLYWQHIYSLPGRGAILFWVRDTSLI